MPVKSHCPPSTAQEVQSVEVGIEVGVGIGVGISIAIGNSAKIDI